jgi:hypothetical protein
MIINIYQYASIYATILGRFYSRIFVSVRFTAYCWLTINAEELQEIAELDFDARMHFENVLNPDV